MRFSYHRSFKKDLKKLPPKTRAIIGERILPQLLNNPMSGMPLAGEFRGYRKLVFHSDGISYRLVYQFNPRIEAIYIVIVSPRGDVYQKLTRRLGLRTITPQTTS